MKHWNTDIRHALSPFPSQTSQFLTFSPRKISFRSNFLKLAHRETHGVSAGDLDRAESFGCGRIPLEAANSCNKMLFCLRLEETQSIWEHDIHILYYLYVCILDVDIFCIRYLPVFMLIMDECVALSHAWPQVSMWHWEFQSGGPAVNQMGFTIFWEFSPRILGEDSQILTSMLICLHMVET